MFRSKITGLGFFVPENIVSNDDLSKLMETSDDWISERTGIKNRRWVSDKSLQPLSWGHTQLKRQ